MDSVRTDRLIERANRGYTSWVPLVYHKLHPSRVGECLTCEDFRDHESGLDHLMRTAVQPERVSDDRA